MRELLILALLVLFVAIGWVIFQAIAADVPGRAAVLAGILI